jgi:hypothetical protein
LGDVNPGGVFGFNFGMGLAINERSFVRIGYDHSSVGTTSFSGATAATPPRSAPNWARCLLDILND